MTNSHFTRRDFLASLGGTALVYALDAPAQTGPRSSITVRIDRELAVLDPAHRTGPWEGNVMRAVFQRLMRQKANSAELELDAAAEIRQVSPTVIDFRLKPGQMFTDGFGEMTAEDVKFSFERIGLPPKEGARESTYRKDWLYLEGVEVRGKYEGRIVLTRARANLYDVVIADGSGCIVPRKAVEQRGADFATRPVGSGPYRLASLERQKGATLRRHAAYAGRRPHFEEIDIRLISDARTTDLALRSGEVDFAILAPAPAEALRPVAGLTVDDRPSIAYVWLGMNVEKAPLSDLRVRQAIRLGLDVDQMLTAGYDGKAPRLDTLLPPQIFGHWKEAPVYRRDVAEAKRLLAAAGVSNLKLNLLILNQAKYRNMALVARAQLAEIGVSIVVDAQEGGTFWNSGKGDTGRNIDLFINRFNGKHDPNFIMQWFVSDQIGEWNWQRWSSPEFDALYARSASEIDPAVRRRLVIDAQRLMDKSAAFVWLTNEANALVYRSWLRPAGVPGWIDWQYDEFGATS
jgi:peptide/nickel transport system substrate-binding protein